MVISEGPGSNLLRGSYLYAHLNPSRSSSSRTVRCTLHLTSLLICTIYMIRRILLFVFHSKPEETQCKQVACQIDVPPKHSELNSDFVDAAPSMVLMLRPDFATTKSFITRFLTSAGNGLLHHHTSFVPLHSRTCAHEKQDTQDQHIPFASRSASQLVQDDTFVSSFCITAWPPCFRSFIARAKEHTRTRRYDATRLD